MKTERNPKKRSRAKSPDDSEFIAELRREFLANGGYDPAGGDVDEQAIRWFHREIQASIDRLASP